jgi:hypothetical protein
MDAVDQMPGAAQLRGAGSPAFSAAGGPEEGQGPAEGGQQQQEEEEQQAALEPGPDGAATQMGQQAIAAAHPFVYDSSIAVHFKFGLKAAISFLFTGPSKLPQPLWFYLDVQVGGGEGRLLLSGLRRLKQQLQRPQPPPHTHPSPPQPRLRLPPRTCATCSSTQQRSSGPPTPPAPSNPPPPPPTRPAGQRGGPHDGGGHDAGLVQLDHRLQKPDLRGALPRGPREPGARAPHQAAQELLQEPAAADHLRQAGWGAACRVLPLPRAAAAPVRRRRGLPGAGGPAGQGWPCGACRLLCLAGQAGGFWRGRPGSRAGQQLSRPMCHCPGPGAAWRSLLAAAACASRGRRLRL